jgi:GNAT superfamily N-acetyltransferase
LITHFLGQPEVDAYLADLVERLVGMDAERPTLWLPIGPSGLILAARILDKHPDLVESTSISPVDFNRTSKEVMIDADLPNDLRGRHVLVLDSSVHSGNTMLEVVRSADGQAAASVTSYSLVLKQNSTFVPTFWGLTINDHDRAYFLLEKMPNNRLRTKVAGTYLRQLSEKDIESVPLVASGLAPMDRVTWADRWFDIRSGDRDRKTYLLQKGSQVVGFVTFVVSESRHAVTVDEVAVQKGMEGQGFGGALLRFVETMARHVGASELNMWAVDKQVPKYETLGYSKDGGKSPMKLEGSDYFFMRKLIIHHVSPLKM